jgi:mutator protein MutT
MKVGKDYIGVGCGPLIINDNNETLLLKRSSNAKNEIGLWQKPGGEVEFGETVIEAIKRETKEEIGVDLEILDFLGYTDHIIKGEEQHWVAFNYLAKISNGTPQILEPHKFDELQWFDLENLPEKTNQTTKEAVARYKKLKSQRRDKWL